ncbi:hypothetical protein HZS_1132 [Henneguya salminicola]|nr:hypothetical protein HZS_1132 [Henneguya salminicola]
MSYKPNDPMEKSYMRLLYIPEFYGFSWAVTKNDSDIKAPNLEKEQDKKIDNQTNKKKAHEESRLFCNRLPRFLKKRLLWELNFMPIILIEDSQNEMLYFYDKSHINSLKTFLENIKKKNIVTKFINHICNTPNSKHSHDKNLDVKENAKKHLCIIIERTFKKGDKLTTYENKLFQLNKLFPGKIIPWANFLTHFFSIFWQHLTKSKGSIKISSPLNTKQSLFAYITKIKSWSAICLASQIIIDNFVEDITYQKFMKSDAIKDTPTSDSETSTEDLISKCTKCSKVYESHTLSGQYISYYNYKK